MCRAFQKLVLSVFLLFPVLTLSETVTNENVSSLSKRFIVWKKTRATNSLQKHAPVSISSHEILLSDNRNTLGHLVHLSPAGFLVLANDTNLPPIVAYSFHQNWPADTSDVLYKIVTANLSHQLKLLSVLTTKIKTAHAEKWQTGFTQTDSINTFDQWPKEGTTATGGWLETTWHQKHPFNKFCPIDPGDNARTLVGCIATTMAQVINYHKNLGSLYFDGMDYYKTLSKKINIDPDSSNLDFPGFGQLNNKLRTVEQKYYTGQTLNENDIAALNFACGIMVEMNYASDISVAILRDVAAAFKMKMDYKSADFVSDSNSRFYDILIENMMNGLPAPLTIAAHAIVADGYNTDGFFHLNFGWGNGNPDEITNCWYLLPHGMPAGYDRIFNGVLNVKPSVDDFARIATSDSTLYLPGVLIGEQSDSKKCVIINEGLENVTIERMKVSGNFLISLNGEDFSQSLGPFTMPPAGEFEFYACCIPDSFGRFKGKVEVIASKENLKRFLTVDVVGYGVPDDRTVIYQGGVAGLWDSNNSPYYICGDIFVKSGESLYIGPDVYVLFQDAYELAIGPNAQLKVLGSERDSVKFIAENPSVGWFGLDFINSGNDDTLSFCTIRHAKNSGKKGGAIYCESSSPFFTNSLFEQNSAKEGGAIYCSTSFPIIKKSVFRNNFAESGGAIFLVKSTINVGQCIFTLNEATRYGGAVFCDESKARLQNVTFSQNAATYYGGAVNLEHDSHLFVKNSIYSENLATRGGNNLSFRSSFEQNSMEHAYSCIDTSGGDWLYRAHNSSLGENRIFWGAGNIFENPQFMDTENNNFKLSPQSPCIDAGGPNDDIGDEPFPHGFRINMGAFGGTPLATPTISGRLAVKPDPIDFGFLEKNEQKTLHVLLMNGSPDILNIVDIQLSDNSHFTVSSNTQTPGDYSMDIGPGDIDSISIQFSSNGSDRRFISDTLRIKLLNAPDKLISMYAQVIIGTPVDSGEVSGIWTRENSPYNIYGDISIKEHKTLVIESGVDVIFMGNYNFEIGENAQLLAAGTELDSIVFTAADTTSGWNGIYFHRSGDDDSLFFCEISHIKTSSNPSGSGVPKKDGALDMEFTSPVFSHCQFKNNLIYDDAMIVANYGQAIKFKYSSFSNNTVRSGMLFEVYSSQPEISNSLICNNNIDFFMAGDGSDILLSNLVITQNRQINLQPYYSSFWDGQCSIILKNSIVWDNLNLSVLDISDEGKVFISFCDIDTSFSNWMSYNGNYSGDKKGTVMWEQSNIIKGPMFVDAANKDFHLLPDSPCVDAGDPNDNIGDEPFPHGYRKNMGIYGGTFKATKNSKKMLTVAPNPLDFGIIGPGNIGQQNILFKNGTLSNILINEIFMMDSTNFTILDDSETKPLKGAWFLNSGEIDSLSVKFESDELAEKTYTSGIVVVPDGCPVDTIQVRATIQYGTSIRESSVSGTWTKGNSPYNIYKNIKIESGNSLVIQPGVSIRFMGPFNLDIRSDAQLYAAGTATDSIQFYAADTSVGWRGITFSASGEDDFFDYCVFKNAKLIDRRSTRSTLEIFSSSPSISHSSFRQNSSDYYSGALYSFNSNVLIKNCFFQGNNGQDGGVVNLQNSKTDFRNCLFTENSAEKGAAIYCSGSEMRLVNSVISQNKSHELGSAIYLSGVNTAQIKNSILWDNKSNMGNAVYTNANSIINIQYSCIDTRNSIWLSGLAGNKGNFVWGYGNKKEDPLFVNATEGVFSLQLESPCIDGGDPNDNIGDEPFPHGYRINMGLYGGTANAAKSTKPICTVSPDPIDFGVVNPGDEKVKSVLLKNGTMLPISITDMQISNPEHFEITSPLLNNSTLNLASGHIDSVQIQLLSNTTSNEYWNDSLTVTIPEIGEMKIGIIAKIEAGTIISAGSVSGTWSKEHNPYNIYGDIYIPIGKKLKIGAGVIARFFNYSGLRVGQDAQLLAIGDVADSVYFQPAKEDVGWSGIIFNNSDKDDTLRFCSMSGGKPFASAEKSNGGALNIIKSSPTILHSCFANNQAINGGAIYFQESNSLVSHCTMAGNRVSQNGGALYVNNSSLQIKNSVLVGNNAQSSGGGAFIVNIGTTIFENVVIADNRATTGCVLMISETNRIYLKNSIFWANTNTYPTGADIESFFPPEDLKIEMNYCCIDTSNSSWLRYDRLADNFIWGLGNIVSSPRFQDPDESDYTLRALSPCIDAGDSGPAYYDVEDPDNVGYALWPAMATIRNDMGAFGGGSDSFWYTSVDQVDGPLPTNFKLKQNYPNPFNSNTIIECALPKQIFVTVNIYNILGQRVKTVANQNFNAGVYQLTWDGTNDMNEQVGTGIYIYQIIAGDFRSCKKMLLMQ